MTSVSNINPIETLNQKQPTQSVNNQELLQEDFLNLMVTQLRNQDPFKPMESGEFLGQLAQFGTVSGIDSLETSFEKLSTSLTSNQALQASTLVGRDVLLENDSGYLTDSGSLSGVVELPSAASQVNVGVYDSNQRLVRQLKLGNNLEGRVEFNWDGLDDSGQRQPVGTYEIRAEATSGGLNQAMEVLINGQVKSVTLGGTEDSIGLEVEGLGKIDFSKVRQIT
jgi:flagellar basal-body rod modification protein FlgD